MTESTKVQIYLGAATLSDVMMCVDAGADFIGLVADPKLIGNPTMGGHVLPSLSEVGEFFRAVQHRTTTVALTFDNKIARIEEMASDVKPMVIHLAGNNLIPIKEIVELRAKLPGIKIMQAIAVNRPNAVQLARTYQTVSDYFLLDSKGEDIDHPYGVGATGHVHDWDVSADIVRKVSIPVILAGGLRAENVRDAVARVGPWGVDSFTLTNLTPDRESRKDPAKVKQFISSVKRR